MMPTGLTIVTACLRTAGKRRALASLVALTLALSATIPIAAHAADDAYRPPADNGGYSGGSGDAYPAQSPAQSPYPAPQGETYEPVRPNGQQGAYRPLDGSRRAAPEQDQGGAGEPYSDAPPGGGGQASREERYEPVAPSDQGGPPESGDRGTFSQNEIVGAGHRFFGNVSGGLASAIEWAFQKAGRPNGYILGQDAGGAIVAGLRYGEGRLHTKDAGDHKVYWQGPSVGYDFGGEGSKVMVLVYNLRDPSEIYNRFGCVQGAAYLVGGVSVQIQKAGEVTLAPIRAGVGLRLGANVGYLKYTRNPTWNPF